MLREPKEIDEDARVGVFTAVCLWSHDGTPWKQLLYCGRLCGEEA